MNELQHNINIIKDYLEKSYSGAKMLDDSEMMVRIARALFAFRADINDDIFLESAIEKSTNV